jgi:hypothetical protein
VRNASFYPADFELYLFTPACAELVPALWYRQLATWYEFDPDLAHKLLVTEQQKVQFLDQVRDAYDKAGIVPKQAAGRSGLNDRVYLSFRPKIMQLAKDAPKDLVRKTLREDPKFMEAVLEVRQRLFSFSFSPASKPVSGFPASVQPVVESCLLRRDHWTGDEISPRVSTGDLWRRASFKAAQSDPDDHDALAFAVATQMTFGEGQEAIADMIAPDNFEFEILFTELTRSVTNAKKMNERSLTDLDPFFGFPKWRTQVAQLFFAINNLFIVC